MADSPVYLNDGLGDLFEAPGATDAAGASYWQTPSLTITESDAALTLDQNQVALAYTHVIPSPPSTTHGAAVCEVIGGLWWDRFHVIPKIIALGNLLSDQVITITVHNAFRGSSVDWLTLTNNLGAGTSLVGLPTFAYTVGPQDGLAFTLNIDADVGPAQVISDLVFTTDVPSTLTLPVSFTRLIVFPFQPQKPVREVLQFSTDILTSEDGTEQRRARRKNPRQLVEMVLRLDGRARQNAKAMLQDHQARLFGLPVWWEARLLSAAASISDTVLNVETTDYADFRDGSLCLLWSSNTHFEAQEISSSTASTITVASPLSKAFTSPGTLVIPLRTAYVSPQLTSQKYPVAVEDFPANFVTTDNDANLADVSAFSTFNGKVLLDDPNVITGGTLPETLMRRVQIIDSGSGAQDRYSPWTNSKPGLVKSAITQSRQSLWEYRQLLHALRGRQVSFYIPTFFDDMTLTEDLASGSTQMKIENIGYTQHVQHRKPFDVIRVVLNDGTTYIRTVTGEIEIDEDEEQLSVDSSWPSTIAKADVKRVEYLLLVRLLNDNATIQHANAIGDAEIQFPLQGLLS
jgi:hypothetical protein